MSVAPVVVPWFGDPGEARVRSRAETASAWRAAGFVVVLGRSGSGVAAARNRGAEDAGGWDVAIFADADVSLADPAQAVSASEVALETGSYVACYDELVYLGPDGAPEDARAGIWEGCFAITRALWVELGGFDERFGHRSGCEGAFIHAAATLAGLARVPGAAFHHWHPPAPPHVHAPDLWPRYRDAEGDPARMRALLAEPRP